MADARRVVEGDVSAFAGIVDRWQARLVSLAWRFCHDRTMAEDMAQDAFVRAYRGLASYRGQSSFSTWLMAVALNTFRSQLRKRPPTMASLDVLSVLPTNATALADLIQRERESTVRQLVSTLPERYRESLILYYFNDMDVSTTASILGVPTGTVKARLARGRALLEQRLTASKRRPRSS